MRERRVYVVGGLVLIGDQFGVSEKMFEVTTMTQRKLYCLRGSIIKGFSVGESVDVVRLKTIKIIHIFHKIIYKANADRMRLVKGNIKDDGEEMVKDGNSLLACRDHDANLER